ncbi:MAG: glycosyltransferase [Flavobacteriales bacterium]|nr:glycosyltransferase [Flavobacteriales bacterium]
MAEKRFFSVILPTFSRPDEVKECLESLTLQTYPDFEVIIADGSPNDDVRPAISGFENKLSLKVIYEKYLPVSAARNQGAEAAQGDWLVFLDSDCIIPPDYLQKVNDGLNREKWDIYGGPDAADPSFSPLQKAISYTMTSLFTTGGIRGKKQHMGTFHPRGFNMGMDRGAFFAVNGYSTLKCGEDVDLSIRLIKSGFKSGLLSEAYVYHKRRTDFAKFYKQVYRFGAARINLYLRHNEELKLTHLFPAVFTVFVSTFWVLFFINTTLGAFVLGGLLLYFLLIFVDSSIQNKSIYVGALSIRAAWVQLTGYGMGFMRNAWEVFVKRNREGINL